MVRPTTYKKATAPLFKEPEYQKSHPEQLLELMTQGMLDCEIYAAMGLKKDTFYRWRREQPDFQEAFEIGLPRCEAWWVSRIRTCWEAGDDKGFKYCIAIMNNKFGWGKEEARAGSVTTNNIQIGNMNVLAQKSHQDLLELLKDDLDYLKLNNVLPQQLGQIIDHDESEQ